MVAVDGQLVGEWRRTLRRDEVVVELTPLAPLTGARRRAVEAAGRRYGAFLGAPAAVA